MFLSETQKIPNEDFWLFHDVEDQEITELRKFIDPELDLSSIKGIDKLIDKLYHLLDSKRRPAARSSSPLVPIHLVSGTITGTRSQ